MFSKFEASFGKSDKNFNISEHQNRSEWNEKIKSQFVKIQKAFIIGIINIVKKEENDGINFRNEFKCRANNESG